MNHDIDPLIGRLAPVTDARAAELLTDETAADLAGRILTAPAEAAEPAVEPAAAPRRRARRRLTVGLPLLATGVAAAAVAAALVTQSGGSGNPGRDPGRPAPSGSTHGRVQLAAALSFTPKGGHIDVRIRDPYADPARYKQEFAAHGLHVSLSLVPVSPSIVGTVVMEDTSEGTRPGDVSEIRVKGACEVASGGDDCTVGVRIRKGYTGTATIVFGRAARHGEQYESSAQATARGEAMHGMTYRGRHVSEVLAALAKRKVTVPEYRVMVGNESQVRRPGQVPGNWYVHDAVPWADGQVMLFVGPKPTEDASSAAPPAAPTAAPGSPSAP
ncbi:hypothetical protein GCM10009527_094790 [Actinomadura nitritigenes]|uniref:PASTA domain-containing protein n=1 Tax=Actinomadura nitritigenes TaxID=134602 RepID=A0ABS3RG16_9ACTN|nr:hypothetical protein [Actinomadura nitritigenes]MBO2445185.1 hypothetical protein [Actinomadura nitritigenes]